MATEDSAMSNAAQRWQTGLKRNLAHQGTALAFKAAADNRQAARKNYLSMAPEARTETCLEVIDEVLIDSPAMDRLTRHARLMVAKRAAVVEVAPGEQLCRLGQPQDRVLLIMSGEVEVTEGFASGPAVTGAQHGSAAEAHLGCAVGSQQGPGSVLRRSDSVGALNLEWLSKQRHLLHSAWGGGHRAGGEEHAPAATPGLLSLAVMTTRKESHQHSEPAAAQAGSGGGPVGRGGDSSSVGVAKPHNEQPEGAPPQMANGTWQEPPPRRPLLGGDDEPQLVWPCTAVARTPVECASLTVQQLAEVLSDDAWDLDRLVDTLESLPIFTPLGSAELRRLARILRLVVFNGGQVVYKQGTSGSDLYVIRSGYVRLLRQVALDDSQRARLNRMSLELNSLKEKTAAVVAHSGCGTPRGGTTQLGARGGSLTARPGQMTSRTSSYDNPFASGSPRNDFAGMQHRSGAVTHRDRLGPVHSPVHSPRSHTGQGPAAGALGSPGRFTSPSRHATPTSPAAAGRMGTSGQGAEGRERGGIPQLPAPMSRGRQQSPPEDSAGVGAAHKGAPRGQREGSSMGEPLGPPGAAGVAQRNRRASVSELQSPLWCAAASGRPTGRRNDRRRSSEVVADEVLAEFGMTPRRLGEHAHAEPEGNEEVLMPTSMLPRDQAHHRTSQQGARPQPVQPLHALWSSPGASVPAVTGGTALPPVVPRLPLSGLGTPGQGQGQGQGHHGQDATAESLSPVPLWQPRAPRTVEPGQEVVFVELGTLGAGQCFGEVRGDGATTRSSSAVCETRAELLVVSRSEVYHQLGSAVFEYLYNHVPTEGAPPPFDPELQQMEAAAAAGASHRSRATSYHAHHAQQEVGVPSAVCAAQLEKSMKWNLYKQKLVAEVLAKKEERKRGFR